MYLRSSSIVSLISVLLAAIITTQTPQPAALPDTPAGKTLSAFLAAFNSGDPASLRKFHTDRGESGDNGDQDVEFYKQTGGLNVSRVIRSTDVEIEILAQAKKDGRWLRFTMEVEPRPPYPTTDIRVRPASGPDDVQPHNNSARDNVPTGPAKKDMSDAEISEALTTYLDQLTRDDKFSGTVIISRGDKPIFEKSYGLADKSLKLPNNLDTKFNLGSMNKMFTAIAIAQLAQQGKLSFDDTVGKYLPDYPNKAIAQNVTIHHLLTHTGGLGSFWNAKFRANRANIKSVSDYLALFSDEAPSFEPGKRFQYSNSGFIVLGAIVEKVSRQDYYDYVREHIYRVAGMRDTDAYQINDKVENIAMGYTNEGADEGSGGGRHENTLSRPNRGGPAGGGYSTARDLLKFAAALRDHKLLNEKYTELVTTGKVDMGGAKYGYGFGEMSIHGKRVVGHNGGAEGIGSDLSIYPDLGYTSVVMTNYDPPSMMAVVRTIREMITQSK